MVLELRLKERKPRTWMSDVVVAVLMGKEGGLRGNKKSMLRQRTHLK